MRLALLRYLPLTSAALLHTGVAVLIALAGTTHKPVPPNATSIRVVAMPTPMASPAPEPLAPEPPVPVVPAKEKPAEPKQKTKQPKSVKPVSQVISKKISSVKKPVKRTVTTMGGDHHTRPYPATHKPTDSVQQSPAATVSKPIAAAYLNNPPPDYPAKARFRRQEGTVTLNVDVTMQGKPASVHVMKSSGYRLLDAEAVRTVKQWRFIPAKLAGKAVRATVTIPIVFQLTS